MTVIQEYIAQAPEEKQARLTMIYETIRNAIPDAEECISWGMPTFRKERNIIHFASAKKHIGLYPGPEAIEAFQDQLKEYKTSKGAIQLPDHSELPLALIEAIACWCYEKYRKA